jgi:hypothetical protein
MASCNKFSCNTHLITRYFYSVLLLRAYTGYRKVYSSVPAFALYNKKEFAGCSGIMEHSGIIIPKYEYSVGNLLFNALRTAAIRQKCI